MMRSWIILMSGGLCEALWAFCLGRSHTGSRWWLLGFAALYILSAVCLEMASREIPVGTAYAVWTGIGASCTILMGITILKEPVTAARLVFLSMIFIAVIGLQLTTDNK